MTELLHEFILASARRIATAPALREAGSDVTYDALASNVAHAANLFLALGLDRRERVAVYMEKRVDAVVALFGAVAAGGVFVPVNPLLKPEQVAHILKDCNVRILVTTPERFELLRPVLASCHDLRTLVICGAAMPATLDGVTMVNWAERASAPDAIPHRAIDGDMVRVIAFSDSRL